MILFYGEIHGHLAGDRFIGQANLMEGGTLTDYNRYREIIKKFIAKNPQRQFYLAAGWVENEEHVTKAYLDEICDDKPLFLHTGGGHSMLLNTKAFLDGVTEAHTGWQNRPIPSSRSTMREPTSSSIPTIPSLR